MPLLPVLVILILNILIDFYIWRCVCRRVRTNVRRWSIATLSFAGFGLMLIAAAVVWPKRGGSDSSLQCVMWILYAYLTIYIPKFVFVLFDLCARIPELFGKGRARWLSTCGLVAGALIFIALWWGALINRFNINVVKTEIEFESLPAVFDGLTIVQISDLHVGTYGHDTDYLDRVVDTINALHPDIILFTGDIVNRRSDELVPFVSTLSRLEAPLGVYSVLGNHDYGDYMDWKDDREKAESFNRLLEMQKAMGWKMLNNATEFLYAGNDSIALVGVENVGDPPFKVYGDLRTSYPGDLGDGVFKILMSHNPAHWNDEIRDSDENIALTLSGHTHAMQIEAFGISPAALRYPTWGGRYDDEKGHTLYVNIGIGAVGMPMRIGATPEITFITLRKK